MSCLYDVQEVTAESWLVIHHSYFQLSACDFEYFLFVPKPCPSFSVVFRGNRSSDLHHCVCFGDNGEIHLQQERDVSEPGSKGSAAWRQPRVPLQQPGGLPERSQWKPKGVFHLAGATSHWPDRTERYDLPSTRCFTRHHRVPQLLVAVDQQDVKSKTEQFMISFVHFWL